MVNYTPSHQLRFASLNLLCQPPINIALASRGFGYADLSLLEFPPSSSQIYRLLHFLQIQSKNSPFLWCKHLWLLAITIHALLIRHNQVDLHLGVILCYVMLGYVMFILVNKINQNRIIKHSMPHLPHHIVVTQNKSLIFFKRVNRVSLFCYYHLKALRHIRHSHQFLC